MPPLIFPREGRTEFTPAEQLAIDTPGVVDTTKLADDIQALINGACSPLHSRIATLELHSRIATLELPPAKAAGPAPRATKAAKAKAAKAAKASAKKVSKKK